MSKTKLNRLNEKQEKTIADIRYNYKVYGDSLFNPIVILGKNLKVVLNADGTIERVYL